MSRLTPRRAALLVALPALAVGAAPLGAATASAVPVATEVLASQVVPGLSAFTRAGDLAPSTPVAVDVLLSPAPTSATTGLTPAQLEAHLYSAGDPLFHQFPTPDQYAAQYAAPASAAAAAVTFGTAHGLRLDSVNAMRDAVVLEGTAAQVEATFSTHLATFRQGSRTFYANTTAPTVPAGIGVVGVTGLDDAHQFTRAATTAGPRTGQTNCAGTLCLGGTTPKDMWVAYDQPTGDPVAPGSTNFGQGQALAVIGEGQTAPVITDLRQYEKEFGLPQMPVTVKLVPGTNGSTDYSDNSGLVEWNIDTQSSTGMAPDASSMTLYFGTGLDDTSLVNAIDAWSGQNDGALQANMSIGGCEGFVDPTGMFVAEDLTFQRGFDAALQEAVNTGRTLFNSSGDTGSGCPVLPLNTNGVAIQPGPDSYPASSPHVTAVGGTVLYGSPGTATGANGDTPITGRSLEYAWTFSGGGTSFDYAEPAYQTNSGLVGTSAYTTERPCVVDPTTGQPYAAEGKTAPTTCREEPDIAAQSGDVATNGYDIVSAGSDSQGGGTSLASPLSMGMWARIQAASPKVGANGFANYALYTAAAAGGRYNANGDFFDVGDTTNGKTLVTTNGAYVTGPGYDQVTGLGVMDVNHLMRDIDGGSTPTNNVLPVPPAATGTPGAGGTGGAPLPAGQAACLPLFTNAPGADNFDPIGLAGSVGKSNKGANPQLNIVQGDLRVVQLDPATHKPAAGGTYYLESVLTMRNLSAAIPTVAGASLAGVTQNQYYLLWTVGGTTYYAEAQVDPTKSAALGSPQVTYGNGKLVQVGTSTRYTNAAGTGDFGTFTPGANGTIAIYVPLSAANVGATAPGSVLSSPSGRTFVEIGNPNTGGSLQPADTAAPMQDYTLGEVCAATGLPGSSGGTPASGAPGANLPESPLAAALPIGGLLLAWRVLRRRRARAMNI